MQVSKCIRFECEWPHKLGSILPGSQVSWDGHRGAMREKRTVMSSETNTLKPSVSAAV